jgi:hypothetical protein
MLARLLVIRIDTLHPKSSRSMQPKQAINTDKAPKALPGIYNQAIVANGTVYCSGSIGMDPMTGEIIKGDIQDRTVCSRLEEPSNPALFLLIMEQLAEIIILS